MDDRQRILDALHAIDPARLNYQEWIDVGMALKTEGFPCQVWDDWSRNDTRYHVNDCEKKWNTFNGAGTTAGTVFHLAYEQGYKPEGKVYSFDDYLPAEVEGYEETIASNAPKKDKPYQMAVEYLKALFEPDEIVGYVHSATYDEKRDKWIPANAGTWRKRDDIIRDLNRSRKLDEAFGSMNDDAGAWIRINPLDGKGANDKNVTRFAYALAESDEISIEEQKKLLVNLRLPIAALVESGGKSVHAIVKVGAKNEAEYKQRVSFLFSKMAEYKFIIDTNNKNPSRLSRLPGAMRKGVCQSLIATNIGCATWEEWVDEVHGVDDDLPPIIDFFEQMQNPPELSPELIGGILREGNKMIITGDSKAGKTCMSQNLAVCIAEGRPWLGKFKCEQGKVLYMNLEVEEASLYHRFINLYKALDIKPGSNTSNIHLWNLRGHALPLEDLADKVIRRCRDQKYKAIILDPLYKVQQGDENSAEAIIKFCNALDKIAHETGAAIIYDHHHPKGDAGSKKAIDRGAGSGVFARDADAICDLSNLNPGNDASNLVKELTAQGERPMELSFVLRDFKDISAIKVWFKFPLHYIDSANILENCYVEGSKEANLSKNPNRKSEDEKRAIVEYAFGVCQEQGFAKLSEMANYAPVKIDALRKYVIEHGDFKLNHGIVSKNDIGEKADIKNV